MPGDPDELRAQRLALASLLGARLVSLGMTKHAEHLRRYYATVRAGREARSGEWSHEHVIRIAQNLRVPPHDRDLPERGPRDGCGCASPKMYTSATWPGGARFTCAACREEWIVTQGSATK